MKHKVQSSIVLSLTATLFLNIQAANIQIIDNRTAQRINQYFGMHAEAFKKNHNTVSRCIRRYEHTNQENTLNLRRPKITESLMEKKHHYVTLMTFGITYISTNNSTLAAELPHLKNLFSSLSNQYELFQRLSNTTDTITSKKAKRTLIQQTTRAKQILQAVAPTLKVKSIKRTIVLT